MWSLASKHALQFQDLSALNDSDDDIGAGSRNGTSKVDIDIFFAAGGHGDHEPFDGRGSQFLSGSFMDAGVPVFRWHSRS